MTPAAGGEAPGDGSVVGSGEPAPGGRDGPLGRRGVPPRGLALSVLCLAVASLVSALWPESTETAAGLVWTLALVPLFLFAYYRGWRGAALASAATMAAFVLVEVIVVDLMGRSIDWRFFFAATVLLTAVTIGTAWLSERLLRERESAFRMAYEDPLTSLPGRRALDFFLGKQVAAARRGQSLAVVFFDLDDFKGYNDAYGHGAGDRFLRRLAEVLERNTREENLTGRYGGEEFLAILPGEDPEGARVFAERIRSEVEAIDEEGRSTPSISAGIADFGPETDGADELLTRADQALYRAKAEGGDAVVVHDPEASTVA